MIILVSSKITQSTIQSSLGKPEYSYFFLLKEFLPVLKRIGEVITVTLDQVDTLYHQYREQGQQVIFLSISPPQQTPVDLECPTICLFAWEFENLPSFSWDEEPRNDWRYVFERIEGGICTSRQTRDLVEQMLPEFPVACIPAPVWNHYAQLGDEQGHLPQLEPRFFSFTGSLIDSLVLNPDPNGLVAPVSLDSPPPPQRLRLSSRLGSALPEQIRQAWIVTKLAWNQWRKAMSRPVSQALPAEPRQMLGIISTETPINLQLKGVVYTTVLNPVDQRKNWAEIIAAFGWAFRDCAEATLVIKMTLNDLEFYYPNLVTLLSRMAPFKCRILVLHGYLEEGQYLELIRATTYYVNASAGEGLCLPLLEFLSAGCPVLAPTHTAMADYMDDKIGFPLQCAAEPYFWPHKPHGVYQTHRYRLNWQSLVEAYRASFAQAVSAPEEYRGMSRQAFLRLRDFASEERVETQLREQIDRVLKQAGSAEVAP
ncbi:glycosyltransferase [Pseudomonas fluvialis]|uniref:glycosyltransferase n=1 Tax=Pseudomonas fluvialis TaxID=1793966 RepID=UPI0035B2ED97